MASWECQSRSSTSGIQTNSKLSNQTNTGLKGQEGNRSLQGRMGGISTENESTPGFSSRESCNGIMGVPITFLDKYNPEQFEILGITLGNTVDYPMTAIYKNAVQHNKDGSTQGGGKVNTRAAILAKREPIGAVYYTADNADGYLLSIYPRILIKRRIHEN